MFYKGYHFLGGSGCTAPVPVLESVPADVTGLDCTLVEEGVYDDILPDIRASECQGQDDEEICRCKVKEEECANLPAGETSTRKIKV